jgi:hypothetical protein
MGSRAVLDAAVKRKIPSPVDVMHLVLDEDQYRALVNTVMNLRFP